MGHLALCSALALAALAGCARTPLPTDYELPTGATGWVTVRFGDPSAPALPVESGHRVVRLPTHLRLVTSSPQQLGTVQQTFRFVDSDGHRTPIEDVSKRADIGARAATMTFPEPVACCLHTADTTENGRRVGFEQLYVGRGPAGEAPEAK